MCERRLVTITVQGMRVVNLPTPPQLSFTAERYFLESGAWSEEGNYGGDIQSLVRDS